MDHDTGFAPHVRGRLCTLCGCKTTTIESWAQPGSWIIGIGGNGTNKADHLIYAMKVESTPTVDELKKHSLEAVRYLDRYDIDGRSRVLVSHFFYYFGNKAITIPTKVREALLIKRQGCKKVSNEDIAFLASFLSKKYPSSGVFGAPNNVVLKSATENNCRCAPRG